MPASPASTVAGEAPTTPRRKLVNKLLKYGAGSVVATVCSELTFLVVYGVLGSTTTVASGWGWVAGALPNFWLNRSWAWGRRGRLSFRQELLPYAVIVLSTLLLAVGATAAADMGFSRVGLSHSTKAVLLSGVFLLVYVLIFFVRFFLLDRLYAPPSVHDSYQADQSDDSREG